MNRYQQREQELLRNQKNQKKKHSITGIKQQN